MRKLALLSALLLICGCAHYPLNRRLARRDSAVGYRFNNVRRDGNSDKLFVVLSFSGGGPRAAALSYGVLKKLAQTKVVVDGKTRRLLDEVDVISSISGGSFTAGYYGLYGDRIFDDYEPRFLKKNIQGALFKQVMNPMNWLRLASPTFDRIDLAAEYYDANVFDHKTFADLLAAMPRPYIIINATDMSLGSRFEFTQDQFDLLHSDLGMFPVSRAVAASSAFPFLLSPVTIDNYPDVSDDATPPWVGTAMQDWERAPVRFTLGTDIQSYRDPKRRYIHLMDGGIADNIGLRGPLQSILTTDSAWSLARMINLGKIDRLVFIVVNAKTTDPARFDQDQREAAPGFKAMAMSVATTPMDNFSADTVEAMRSGFSELVQAARSVRDCSTVLKQECPAAPSLAEMHMPELYPIVVSFDALQDEKQRNYFNGLPTSFNLPGDAVDHLEEASAKILADSSEFQRLLKDIGE